MTKTIGRREFLQQSAGVGAALALAQAWPLEAAPPKRSPQDKLNIACIGVGGQGASDVSQLATENIVALCDVDDARAAGTFSKFPNARKYKDYRLMLEREKNIEAVLVSTPDHSHASAAVMAMKLGKHVYCQKPLAHSVAEAQVMLETARKQHVVTQMGTQGHPGYVGTVELIQSGAIGPVHEAHVITDRPIWPQGMAKAPEDHPPVPATLDWELWLGPAQERAYNPAYLPFVWRGWWDFGTGALGDMGCHLMDAPFWALGLGAPTRIEAEAGPVSPVSPPTASVIHYEFPARGEMPPVKLTWYDGGKMPPAEVLEGLKIDHGFNGTLFIGDKGKLLSPHGGAPVLLPAEKFKDFQPPKPTLRRSPGHYQEWIEACKTGSPTGSPFEYSVPLTQAVLLGNVALRVSQPIEWDGKRRKATNCPAADQYVQYHYREGWKL